MTSVLIKTWNVDTDTCTQGKCHAKVKAGIGRDWQGLAGKAVMLLQAKEQLSAIHQKLRESHGMDSHSQDLGRTNSADTLVSGF